MNNFFTFRSLPIFEATHFETRADSREASREAVSIFEKKRLERHPRVGTLRGGPPVRFPSLTASHHLPLHAPPSSRFFIVRYQLVDVPAPTHKFDSAALNEPKRVCWRGNTHELARFTGSLPCVLPPLPHPLSKAHPHSCTCTHVCARARAHVHRSAGNASNLCVGVGMSTSWHISREASCALD